MPYSPTRIVRAVGGIFDETWLAIAIAIAIAIANTHPPRPYESTSTRSVIRWS